MRECCWPKSALTPQGRRRKMSAIGLFWFMSDSSANHLASDHTIALGRAGTAARSSDVASAVSILGTLDSFGKLDSVSKRRLAGRPRVRGRTRKPTPWAGLRHQSVRGTYFCSTTCQPGGSQHQANPCCRQTSITASLECTAPLGCAHNMFRRQQANPRRE